MIYQATQNSSRTSTFFSFQGSCPWIEIVCQTFVACATKSSAYWKL